MNTIARLDVFGPAGIWLYTIDSGLIDLLIERADSIYRNQPTWRPVLSAASVARTGN